MSKPTSGARPKKNKGRLKKGQACPVKVRVIDSAGDNEPATPDQTIPTTARPAPTSSRSKIKLLNLYKKEIISSGDESDEECLSTNLASKKKQVLQGIEYLTLRFLPVKYKRILSASTATHQFNLLK